MNVQGPFIIRGSPLILSFLSRSVYFYSHDILLHRKVKVSCLTTDTLLLRTLQISAHNSKSGDLE